MIAFVFPGQGAQKVSMGKGLAPELRSLAVHDPACPVMANLDALPETTAVDSIEALVKQVSSPVRWGDVVRRLVAQGATTFVELGPGTVLAGLINKTERSLAVLSIENARLRMALSDLKL